MNDISTGANRNASIPVGNDAILPTETAPAEAAPKAPAPILDPTSVRVSTPTQAEVVMKMMDSAYETSRNIVNNMVDTPEERREKEERRLEEEAKAADEAARLEKSELKDEIVAKTQVAV